MFIFNDKEVAFDAMIEVEGVYYSVANPNDREAVGVIQVDDPVWPEPSYAYNVTKNPDGSLNVAKKSDEEIAKHTLNIEAHAAQAYLDSTDYLFTVDKYSTLTDERKTELTGKRDTARQKVRDYAAIQVKPE